MATDGEYDGYLRLAEYAENSRKGRFAKRLLQMVEAGSGGKP